MPIYEYKCDLCNGMWEEIQKFSDPVLTVCKSCEKEGGLHKLLPGGMNFILKGRGWANEGYHPDLTKPLVKNRKVIKEIEGEEYRSDPIVKAAAKQFGAENIEKITPNEAVLDSKK